METVSFKPTKVQTSAAKKLDYHLMPISPGEQGKGLPYAPMDWPNPGNVWDRKVGTIIGRNGFYGDRYLIAPQALHERPNRQLLFLSKSSVTRYIQSKFPNADFNAFFASFTWKIQANITSQGTGLERADGVYTRTRKSTKGHKSEESTDKFDIELTTEVSSDGGASSSNTMISEDSFEDGEAPSRIPAACPNAGIFGSTIGCKFDTPQPPIESEAELTVEEFNKYVEAQDEILSLPLPRGQSSCKSEEMIAAREKLSSLLAMDFASLIPSDELAAYCALKLQNDPNLSPQEHSMIKLMQEIPLTTKSFLEVKATQNGGDNFFANLDSKIAFAASQKQEYIKSKEEIEVLQAEKGSVSSAMMETDEQIAHHLQSYRSSLAEALKMTRKKILQHTSSQKKVMDSLPKIVREVQAVNSMKSEWELKRMKSAEEEEILTKFSPLKGFSF